MNRNSGEWDWLNIQWYPTITLLYVIGSNNLTKALLSFTILSDFARGKYIEKSLILQSKCSRGDWHGHKNMKLSERTQYGMDIRLENIPKNTLAIRNWKNKILRLRIDAVSEAMVITLLSTNWQIHLHCPTMFFISWFVRYWSVFYVS